MQGRWKRHRRWTGRYSPSRALAASERFAVVGGSVGGLLQAAILGPPLGRRKQLAVLIVRPNKEDLDRAAELIRLTEAGTATTKLGKDIIRGIERQISAILSDEGHQHLRALLTRLLEDADEV